jgi:hypothetical protein
MHDTISRRMQRLVFHKNERIDMTDGGKYVSVHIFTTIPERPSAAFYL